MLTHVCQTCATTFTRPHNPQRAYSFCSYLCRAESTKTLRAERLCVRCQTPFTLWPYEIAKGRKVCSKVCADRVRDFGKTTEAVRLRTSIRYGEWRKSVFERDMYTCQICGQVGGKLNADHIKRFSDHPELRLDLNNGRTLCEPCHLRTPTFGNRKIKNTDTKWDVLAVGQEA